MAKSHRSTSISFSTQSKKAQQKTRAQLAELAVVSEITGYSIEALIERAFDNFLESEGSILARLSRSALKRRAAKVGDKVTNLWMPLWAVFQDGWDVDPNNSFQEIGPPEPGDPGSLGDVFQAMADTSAVDLIHIVRAALYSFEQQMDGFVADPHNVKYRIATPEEMAVIAEVRRERADEHLPSNWNPVDDPLFHQKLQQRIDDSIGGFDTCVH